MQLNQYIISRESHVYVSMSDKQESDSYRLYKHIVFAKQEGHSAVLMQGLHIFTS